MSFCTTAEVDLGLLQHLRRKKALLWRHTHTKCFITVAHFGSLYCTSLQPYATPNLDLFSVQHLEQLNGCVLLYIVLLSKLEHFL